MLTHDAVLALEIPMQQRYDIKGRIPLSGWTISKEHKGFVGPPHLSGSIVMWRCDKNTKGFKQCVVDIMSCNLLAQKLRGGFSRALRYVQCFQVFAKGGKVAFSHRTGWSADGLVGFPKSLFLLAVLSCCCSNWSRCAALVPGGPVGAGD